jgi:hypothetical protein
MVVREGDWNTGREQEDLTWNFDKSAIEIRIVLFEQHHLFLLITEIVNLEVSLQSFLAEGQCQ